MRTGLVCASLFTLFACGSDGPGVVIEPDAEPTTDFDAAPTNTATKLGKICTAPTDCPAEAAECIALEQNATQGQCSLSCGQTNTDQMPPEDGAAMCQAQYDGTSGTPACIVNDGGMAGTFTWYCGIACGTFMNQGQTIELGTCPNNMTCTDNACLP